MNRIQLPQTPDQTRPSILDFNPEQWKVWLAERNQPAMRARQIRRWLIVSRATSVDQMTDLPLVLREQLNQEMVPFSTRIERHLRSIDGTEKLLLQLKDGHRIECVLLKEEDRRTVCISTQVGCGMGCVFCASGLEGVVRNLTSGEILEQLIQARNLLPETERLTHIVVMGMGEPLANLENLFDALAVASSPEGLGLSQRNITVSTVGLPAKIRRFAELGKKYHLAVSLHAPNEAVRHQIVPTSKTIPLASILEAADDFYARTGRQVTYEYVLLKGINDRREHAVELARLLHGRQAHINLIPFNPVPGLPYQRISQQDLDQFLGILRKGGMTVHTRKRKGADIEAACGQLRRQTIKGMAEETTSPLNRMEFRDSQASPSVDMGN